MKLPDGAIVAVIDGEKVKLFRNTGQDDAPKLSALPEPTVSQDNMGQALATTAARPIPITGSSRRTATRQGSQRC